MAYQKPNILSIVGRTIKIEHQSNPEQPKTYLTASVAASGTSLTVADNSGLADNNLVRIGKIGEKATEIIDVNGAVTRGTALTVAALSLAHGKGAELQKVLFDQWKIYGNSSNSTTGLTLIATIDQTPDAPVTTYVNAGTEYAYYFVLPYDSVNATDGDAYSDGVASTGHAELSVGKVVQKAMWGANAKMEGSITEEWLFSEINDCLRYVTGKMKRWMSLQSFDYSLGSAELGDWSWSMPSDIEEPDFHRSILGVRVGDGDRLTWKDKREWETLLYDVTRTQVTTQASAADTTLEIDNSYDFADSGTVNVFISGTKYDITYTGVTRSTTAGVLTGVPASGSGSISVTIPVDTDVWQGVDTGKPLYFTVFDDKLFIYPIIGSDYDYTNIWMDYFTNRTAVDSYGDVLEHRRYDAVKHWLIWKIRARLRGDGKLDMKDGDYLIFMDILEDIKLYELGAQKYKMYPSVQQRRGRT